MSQFLVCVTHEKILRYYIFHQVESLPFDHLNVCVKYRYIIVLLYPNQSLHWKDDEIWMLIKICRFFLPLHATMHNRVGLRCYFLLIFCAHHVERRSGLVERRKSNDQNGEWEEKIIKGKESK